MTINNTNLTYDTRKKALRGGKKRAVSETDKEALETKFLWQHNQSQGFCFFHKILLFYCELTLNLPITQHLYKLI